MTVLLKSFSFKLFESPKIYAQNKYTYNKKSLSLQQKLQHNYKPSLSGDIKKERKYESKKSIQSH